jgi:DHA1 family bicyclomycin/chloramphenicol resistance-like MFS transporter
MHIFVPALPHAARDLGASVGAMQLTVSLYILGLAAGQLVYGPLSDRFGRRPVLMAGLVVYTIAGFAAAFALSVQALVAARLFQALGGCSGLVLGRAIVRDTAEPPEAARRLAIMNLMVTLGPGLAPILGGILASTTGWRSIFFVLCGLGIANLIFAYSLLPETRAADGNSSVAALAQNYWQLLRSPAFLGFAVGGGCATTSMYAFVAAAPFIFVNELHRPAYEVGVYLGLLIVGVWLGTVMMTWLIQRVAVEKLLVRSSLLSVLAAFAFLVAALSSHLSVALIMAPMFIFTLGIGIASPAALTQAVSVNPHVIGSASGLYGFAQMAVGALCTTLVGFGSDPALAAATVLAAAGVIGQISFGIALRRARKI